jgi:predicted O-methyltransferase YrrM
MSDLSIVHPEVDEYLHNLQKSREPVLQEMEERAAKEGFPIIGPLVGRLCKMLALSIGARDIFELGSGFGYSTYWFAQAVGAHGRVVHTDGDAKKSADAKAYLKKAGLEPRVHFEVGDALEILKKYPGPFDILFCDIDKHGYPEALELMRSRVRVGGYLITDNTLWSGRMLQPSSKHTPDTKGVVKYNQAAFAAPDLLSVIVPLRDGVNVSLKIAEEGRRRK